MSMNAPQKRNDVTSGDSIGVQEHNTDVRNKMWKREPK